DGGGRRAGPPVSRLPGGSPTSSAYQYEPLAISFERMRDTSNKACPMLHGAEVAPTFPESRTALARASPHHRGARRADAHPVVDHAARPGHGVAAEPGSAGDDGAPRSAVVALAQVDAVGVPARPREERGHLPAAAVGHRVDRAAGARLGGHGRVGE